MRRRQCRIPTILFWVGTRHCRLLYYSGATEIDITDGHRLLFMEKVSAIALTFLLISETNFPEILPSHLFRYDRP